MLFLRAFHAHKIYKAVSPIDHEHIVEAKMVERIQLEKGWKFKQDTALGDGAASDKYYEVAQFPTVAHLDLLKHGFIHDPYADDNELKVGWVDNADWSYRFDFDASPLFDSTAKGEHVQLVFEGLDTFVDVYLNGQIILHSRNMFLSHKIDIKTYY